MNLAELLLSLIERTGFATDAEQAAHKVAAEAVHGLEDRLAAVERHLFGDQAPTSPQLPASPASSASAGAEAGASEPAQ